MAWLSQIRVAAGRLTFTGQTRFAPGANRSGLPGLVHGPACPPRCHLRLGRGGLLRLGSGLVRRRLRYLGRLRRLALVGRRPRLRDPCRLGRRLQLLSRSDTGLSALDALIGSVDHGLNLGLLCGDLVDDLLDGRLCGLDAGFVFVEHRVSELLERTDALALEIGPLSPGAEEVDLAAAAGGDGVSARGKACPEAPERVFGRAPLLRPRTEEDDRGSQERHDPPRPDAGGEEEDGTDEERPR